ncbi:MAG: response regulator, partial [Phaeodactylibacter sp.]|nr:response regulator [Phaeodactylibacter sp.]
LMLAQRQSQIEAQKQELETKNREISEQRDQLIELNEKVRMVNQLRLRFFTNISHEFRTPLTLIIDPIESLLEKLTGDKEVRRTLHIINRNAQRLLHLINQLMNFRRLEEGKTNVKVAKGDLVNFIKDIFLSFRDLADHQKIQYHFHLADPQREAWFDAEKLENILYNLLSNAFKYTPPKGAITLSLDFKKNQGAGDSPQYFELTVTDTGVGISAEHLQYIFDHFYQTPSTENSRIEGSGIGLALTRELARILHGDISVSSEVGKGSAFTVRLPYSQNAFSEEEVNEQAPSRLSNLVTPVASLKEDILSAQRIGKSAITNKEDKDKPLVLIVEDNYDLRAFLTQGLTAQFRILEAENGKEGFAFAQKYTPDLIVSDIMMPYIDGLELCSRLKNDIHTSHIPVILLTSKAMVENWVDGLESGADDYIPKPFNLRILIARIDNLIRSRRQLRLLFENDPTLPPEKVATTPLDKKFLNNIYEILEAHYTDQEFSHDQFASQMCMSRSLLYKKIKSLTDMSVTDFINYFKLKKATGLLRQEDVNISEVAYKTGFSDPKYFSRLFKKFYGMPPSDYASCETEKNKIDPKDFESRLN